VAFDAVFGVPAGGVIVMVERMLVGSEGLERPTKGLQISFCPCLANPVNPRQWM
jgi:hypothetical protein